MSLYNLRNLTPYDFERLARDIAQKILNVRVESFTNGKDGGVDFRYGEVGQDLIIQAKHIQHYNDLKSQIKKEFLKISQLNPKRYLLISSTEITPANKKEIRNLLHPYTNSNKDILGKDDIDNVLENDSDLAKRHYKLWFSSIDILQRIFNNASFERSKAKYEDIVKKLKFYVPTKNLDEAKNILDKKNFLIISGIPGIGKTSLADILSVFYLESDYEFIYVQSIEEAENVFDSNKKQFFYFDDFLGKNILMEGKGIEESRLAFFLKRISESSNKKLIMTTREYILRQAKQVTDVLNKKNVSYATCILELEDYTRYQKAQILYNHLYHSNISSASLNSILKNSSYLKIIDHPNYNPRLIELITQTDEFSLDSKKSFYSNFLSILDDPQAVWDKAFNNIHPSSQYLLYSLLACPDEVEMDKLKNQYDLIVEYCNEKQRCFLKKDDFEKSLKELDDSFIKIALDGKIGHKISFKNPSIKDYLINHTEEKDEVIISLFRTSQHLGSLYNIFSIRKKDNSPSQIIFGNKKGKEKIYINKSLHEEISKIIIERFRDFPDTYKNSKLELSKIVQTINFWGLKTKPNIKRFIKTLIVNFNIADLCSKQDFENYFSIIKKLGIDSEKTLAKLAEHSLNLLENNYIDLEVARIVALVYEEARYEITSIAESMDCDFENKVKNIVISEVDFFEYYSESNLRETIEGIEEIEFAFSHDYTKEKSRLETSWSKDIDYYDEYRYEHFSDNKEEGSDAEIKTLFSTL